MSEKGLGSCPTYTRAAGSFLKGFSLYGYTLRLRLGSSLGMERYTGFSTMTDGISLAVWVL